MNPCSSEAHLILWQKVDSYINTLCTSKIVSISWSLSPPESRRHDAHPQQQPGCRLGNCHLPGAQLTQSVGLQAFNAVDSSSVGTVQTDFDFLTWSPGVTLLFTASSTSSTITFTDLTDVANSGPLNWDLDTVTVSDVVSPVTSGTPEPGSLFMLGGALIALTARYRHSRS